MDVVGHYLLVFVYFNLLNVYFSYILLFTTYYNDSINMYFVWECGIFQLTSQFMDKYDLGQVPFSLD